MKKYYDSSKGTILIDNSYSELFNISCGVKQGGILSPFLFNIFIDDLLNICLNLNIGALFNDLNTSIIVYADDILLISPINSHLQTLLDICSKYGQDWNLKFNSLKSNIISFGKSNFEKPAFYLNSLPLGEVENLKYLGTFFNSKLDFDKVAIDKLNNVRKSIFLLSFIGLKPHSIFSFLQSVTDVTVIYRQSRLF